MTRARQSVTILAGRQKLSTFARELVKTPEYKAIEIGEPGIAERHCPSCGGRMLAQTAQSGSTLFACEHRHLCGQTQKACSACGEGLPVKNLTDQDNLICRCGAAFPACPACADGWLVERRGRNGTFLGCVNYPACNGTQNLSHREGRGRRRQSALENHPERDDKGTYASSRAENIPFGTFFLREGSVAFVIGRRHL